MSCPRLIAIAASILLAPLPVLAGWQQTEWGMTPEEVTAVVPGAEENSDRLRDVSDENLKAMVTAPYSAPGFEFLAFFLFGKESGLQEVRLEPQGINDCHLLRARLQATYGPPWEEETVSDIIWHMRWADVERGNSVTFTRIGQVSCSIIYRKPGLLGHATGL